MGIKDVAGIFDRRFVVSYFVPWFVVVVVLSLVLDRAWLPAIVEPPLNGSGILVLGGTGAVAGLLLQALNYPLTRLLEGYPLERGRVARVGGWLKEARQREYDELTRVIADKSVDEATAVAASWGRARYFPPRGRELLPTRLGNAYRSFERYSDDRYGMDAIIFWPRIEPSLSDVERDLHTNAQIPLDFWTTTAVASVLTGVVLVADGLWFADWTVLEWACRIAPLPFSYIAYRRAVHAAVQWGDVVRASMDLHHKDVYELMGFRAPTSAADERELARKVKRFVMYGNKGKPPDDSILPPSTSGLLLPWSPPQPQSAADDGAASPPNQHRS